MSDGFMPTPAVLAEIEPMLADNALFTFAPSTPMPVAPGQFYEISIPGVGSFPVSACDLVREGRITSCIRRVGRVTSALYTLSPGSAVGLRGPFGRGFDLSLILTQPVLLIAGGLGMAPLRALLKALLETPKRQAKTVLLYGARELSALLFRDELLELSRQGRIDLRFSVDFAAALPDPAAGAVCRVGLVNQLLAGLDLVAAETVVVACGPPALYSCLLEGLAGMGFAPQRIFATLERRMRCGRGECCHCVVAGRYICREGPVFSLTQLREMPGAL
ncbi:MAG: oxidoreductase [Desulfuromonas sp.]|nr:MAG: oxidoreductase [Desulfuromonas sp.]